MKKIILSVICFVATIVANAQAPSFQWAKGMSGTSDAGGNAIALDVLGNVYTTGTFYGTVDFDPSPGTFNLTAIGNTDIFISKLDASGNFLWAKSIGGDTSDAGNAIAIDAAGNVYTAGYFSGTVDFDPGSGIYNLTSGGAIGSDDIFISKLDASGNFVWAKNFGGTGCKCTSIKLDTFGNVFTTGYFSGTLDFDPGAGSDSLSSFSGAGIFISKLDSLGNFVWAKNMGGIASPANIEGYSIAIDAFNNVYTTGSFKGIVDFDPGASTFSLTAIGVGDIFVSKLDAFGNFVWAKQIIGDATTFASTGHSIAIDGVGNAYTTGNFRGTVDFDPGAGIFNLTSTGFYYNMFILKLDASGNFIWVDDMGGTGASFALGASISIDATDNIYTTGNFYGTVDFDPGTGAFDLINTSTSNTDMFISKLDASGNFVWAGNISGAATSSSAGGSSIAVDASDNIYTTGSFYGTVDFDPGAGIDSLTATAGYDDIFVLKLSQTPMGINEYANNNNISIYPNPNNGQFNIVVSSPKQNTSLEIYNSIGAIVYSQKIVNEQNTVELTNEANGLYFVKVMCDGKMVGEKKIVKE